MRVRSHFDATAHLWTHGEPVLAWHFLPEGQLDTLGAWLEPMLDRPYLAPVPAQWLHLTTQAVGVEDNVPVEELVAEAGRRLAEVEPVDLLLGPVQVLEEGIRADVQPVEPLLAVRDLLQDADATVRGRHAVPDWRAPFHPHVSFAYATADAEAEPIEAHLLEALYVDALTLIRLYREPRLYRWDVVARVPLKPAE